MATPKEINDANKKIAQARAEGKTRCALGGGLSIKLYPNTGRAGLFSYRYQGQERYFDNSNKITIADAFDQHRAAIANRKNQKDPVALKRLNKQAAKAKVNITFREALILWKENRVRLCKATEESAHDAVRAIELHIFGDPPLSKHKNKVVDIAAHKASQPRWRCDIANKLFVRVEYLDLKERLDHFYQEGNGRLEMLERIIFWLSDLYKFHSHIQGINIAKELKGHYLKPEPKEIPALLEEFELTEFFDCVHHTAMEPITRLGLYLQAMIFVRSKTLVTLKWSYIKSVDMFTSIIHIPKEDLKGGKKRNSKVKDLKIPITVELSQLLDWLKRLSRNSEYILPSRGNPKKHMSSQTITAVIKRMGYGGRMSAHSFRKIYSTILHSEGRFDEAVIERALSHVLRNRDVFNIYNKSDDRKELTKIMQFYTNRIGQLMSFDAIMDGLRTIPPTQTPDRLLEQQPIEPMLLEHIKVKK